MKFLCAIHSKWSRNGPVFGREVPVADQPFEVLQVILVRARHVGGIPPDDHDPLAVAPGVDHGVTRCRVGILPGQFDLGDAFFHGDVGAQEAYRLDGDGHGRAVMLLEQVGVFLFDRGATVEGLSRFVGVLGVRRPEVPTALASPALKALTNSSAVARIAFSSAALSDLGCNRCWLGWCSRFGRGRVRRLRSGHEARVNNRGKCRPEEQDRPEGEPSLLRWLLHG